MKKNLKRNIAFLMATLMGFAAAPVDALANTREPQAVPSNAIPGLVHGNIPFVTQNTRFVSPNFLDHGNRSTTNHYIQWRELRLDFSGNQGVSPWGQFLQTNVAETTVEINNYLPWSNARTALFNYLNNNDNRNNVRYGETSRTDIWNAIVANTPALVASEYDSATYTLALTYATIYGANLNVVSSEANAALGLGNSISAAITAYNTFNTNNPTIAARVNAINALLDTFRAVNALSGIENPVSPFPSNLGTFTGTAAVATFQTAFDELLDAVIDMGTQRRFVGTQDAHTLNPVRFVIPLNLTNAEWLGNQGLPGSQTWLNYAVSEALFHPTLGAVGGTANSRPLAQLVSQQTGVYVNNFQRLNEAQATLHITLANPGVLYVPLPVVATSADANPIVQQVGGVAVLEVVGSNHGQTDIDILNARPTTGDNAVRVLAVDRMVGLTVAQGTLGHLQVGNITNTTVPNAANNVGRNTVSFSLNIAEVVTHHRFGAAPATNAGLPAESGHTRGAEGIAFELIAPVGFTWSNNFGHTGVTTGQIGIDGVNSTHLSPNPQTFAGNHTFPSSFNVNYGADQFFYIYRTPDGGTLRFIERAQPAQVGGLLHVAGERATAASEIDRGGIIRSISGLPHNVLGQLRFTNLQLVHNNPNPAEQSVYIQIRNIPQNSIFQHGNVGAGWVTGPTQPSVPTPSPDANYQGLPPGHGTGQLVQQGQVYHRLWPAQQVISVHEQVAVLAGRIGYHAVTLYGIGEVPTIIAGRLPLFGHVNSANSVEWNQVRGRRVRVLEEVALSLWGEHTNVFEITEGVRIERITLVPDNFGGRQHPVGLNAATLAGQSNAHLRTVYNTNLNIGIGSINARVNNSRFYLSNVVRPTTPANARLGFAMDIYINAPSNFQGPVYLYWTPTVTAFGAQNEQQYVRIANVVRPVELESSFTNIVVGYQFVNVGNFTITENVAGALLQNEQLHISLSDFVMPLPDVIMDSAQPTITYGNIELSMSSFLFDGRQHTMGLQPNFTLYVDRASTVPSVIEFTNVSVRSLNNTPLSNVGYDLVLWGRAIAPNFNHVYNTVPANVRNLAVIGSQEHPGFTQVAQANDRTIRGVITNALASRSLFDHSSLITELFVTLDGHATGAPIVNEVVTIAGSGAVTIGGQPFNFDPNEFGAPHVNANGVAVLPARMALSILFGADPMDSDLFVWDPVNSVFYVDPQGRNIRFQVGNSTMWVHGVARQILSGEGANAFATAAYVDIAQNSRLFVPLRAIAEVVGFGVSWDASTATVTLTPQ